MVASVPGRLLDLAFPARCPGCGREGEPICAPCAPALDARLELPAGVPIGLPSEIPAPLLQLEWCAAFSGVVRHALHQLKYGGETRLAIPLGHAIARRWAKAGAGGDVIVPVPVHADRRRRRGYDQAELIARVAAADLHLPFAPILARARATTAQFDLDRSTRATNVRGAFALRAGGGDRGRAGGDRGRAGGDRGRAGGEQGPPGGEQGPPAGELGAAGRTRGRAAGAPGGGPDGGRPHGEADGSSPHGKPLAGRWIVLVDDVVTTGATLSACAEPLLEAGALGVSAITVARER